jgi:hypothetical protein
MSDTVRRILLAIFLFGTVGITVELLLLGHVEGFLQLVPLVLAAVAVAAIALAASRPSAWSVGMLQLVMASLILSGVAGMALHFKANTEFQLEMDPSLTGMALVRKAIVAKAPPALAPGAMIQLGLIGLAYTFRHPGRRPSSHPGST